MYPAAGLASRHEPNWDDYRIFAALAKQRSFGQAAKALRLSKPTIRRRIESLETSIGVRLVDRGATGIVLTQDGRNIADMVEAMAMISERTVARVRQVDGEISGECKLVLGEGLATAWFIPHFLGIFGDLYPRIVIRLGSAPDGDKIAIPPFDIQVRYAPTHDENLLMFRVATFHFTYFASRKYLERFGKPASRDDLGNHRLGDVTASFGAESGIMAQYSNATALGRPHFYTNSGNILLQSVLAGQVIGLLPSYTFVTTPELVPIVPDYHFETGLFVYFSDAASGKKPTRVMIDFLRNIVFDKQRMPWFSDTYQAPSEDWRRIFAELTDAAVTYMPPSALSRK